jgi:RNA 2',3'-cyclic 3'-phosphodiesterase
VTTEPGIRTFIAIELSQELKSELAALQAKLKSPACTFIKWVAPDCIHITLKFLGNIPLQKVGAITAAIEQSSLGTAPFSLGLTELGAFPNLQKPGVLWVGIGDGLDKLATLQQRIDNNLLPLGFARENRPFSPHITLARLRESATLPEKRTFGERISSSACITLPQSQVDHISFMKSRLMPAGPVYSHLAEILLKR